MGRIFRLVSFLVFIILSSSSIYAQCNPTISGPNTPGLYINEIQQGSFGAEYVELVVVGNPTCQENCLDITNWIIDDNCGILSGCVTPEPFVPDFCDGQGIAAEHIIFKDIPQWECVPFGTLIVVHAKTGISFSDDVNDSDGDGVYIIPWDAESVFEYSTGGYPNNAEGIDSYNGSTYTSTASSSNPVSMSNSNDGFATYSPTDYTMPFHAFGWGAVTANVTCAIPEGNIANTNSVDIDPLTCGNYSDVGASGGMPNSPENADWLASMSADNLYLNLDSLVMDETCAGNDGAIQILFPPSMSSSDYNIAWTPNTYSGNPLTSLPSGSYTAEVCNLITGCDTTLTIVLDLPDCCPDLSAAPSEVTIDNESTCLDCSLSGGQVSDTDDCPSGSTKMYSTDGGVTWSSTLPTYDQENSITIEARCECDMDSDVVSPTSTVATDPGVCDIAPDINDNAFDVCDLTMLDLTVYEIDINNNSGLTFSWYDGDPDNGGTPFSDPFNVDITGIDVWVVLENTDGCAATAQIFFTEIDCCPDITLVTTSITICEGACSVLEINNETADVVNVPFVINGTPLVSIPVPPGMQSIPICYGATSPPLFIPIPPSLFPAGTYTLSIPNFTHNGCDYNIGSLDLTLAENPDAGDVGTLSLCTGDPISESILFDALGGTPQSGGVWSPSVPSTATVDAVYTYTVNSSCGSDQATVSVMIASSADAGDAGTLSLCTGDPISESILFGALGGTPQSGGVWSPSVPSTATMDAVYTYTVNSSCGNDQATVSVMIASSADAGDAGTLSLCNGDALSESILFGALGGTPQSGGVWSPSVPSTVTVDAVYTYTVNSSCGNDQATVSVMITSSADAGDAGTLSLCTGDPISESILFDALGGTPQSGGVWSPSVPSTATMDAVYTYTVNSSCGSDQATVSVMITSSADAGDAGTLSLCNGDALSESILFGALGGTPQSGGVWSPSVPSTVTVDAVYTYTVNSSCGNDQATVSVMIASSADAGDAGTLNLCTGDPISESILFGALGGTPQSGGVWSPSVPSTVTMDAVYTYTVNSSCGNDQATVSVMIASSADAGDAGTLNLCTGDPISESILFGALGGTPQSGGVWSPSVPSTVTMDAVYTYTVNSSCGNDQATVSVTINSSADAGDDGGISLCFEAELSESILFGGLGGTPQSGGSWSPSIPTSVTQSQTYTYTVNSASCGSDMALVNVTLLESASAGEDGTLSLCSGDELSESMFFAALGGTPQPGGIWIPAISGNATSNVTYKYRVDGICGKDSSEIMLTVNTVADAGDDGMLMLCEGLPLSEDILFAELGGTPQSGGTWLPAVPSVVMNSGTYEYSINSSCGTDKASINIEAIPIPDPPMIKDSIICLGDSYSIPVVDDVLFYDSDVSEVPLISIPDIDTDVASVSTYWAAVKKDGCESSRIQFAITVKDCNSGCLDPAEITSISSDQSICEGDDVNLSVATNQAEGQWSITSGNGQINDSSKKDIIFRSIETGVVVLTYTTDDPDGDGICEPVSEQVTVTINELPEVNTPPPFNICEGIDEFDVTVQNDLISAGNSIIWYSRQDLSNEINDPTKISVPTDVTQFNIYALAFNGTCESEVIIQTVNIVDNVIEDYPIALCAGETMSILGQTINSGDGVVSIDVAEGSSFGCDSTLNVIVTELMPTMADFMETYCDENQSVQIGATTYDVNNRSGQEVLENADGCDSIVTISLDYILMDVTYEEDYSCSNDDRHVVNIMDIIQGTQPYTVIADDGTASTFTDASLPYSVEVQNVTGSLVITDINGCRKDLAYTIPVETSIDAEVSYEEGTIQVTFIGITEDQLDSVRWKASELISCQDCLIPTVTPGSEPAVLSLEIFYGEGCSIIREVVIPAEEFVRHKYTFPNVIYAGDSDNGVFTISLYGDDRITEMYIYDRWGQRIYGSIDEEFLSNMGGWNGKWNNDGRWGAGGVYNYLIRINEGTEGINTYIGDVTLLR